MGERARQCRPTAESFSPERRGNWRDCRPVRRSSRCSLTTKSCVISRVRVRANEKTLEVSAILATIDCIEFSGRYMQALSARDAKYNFGRLLDMARAEPVVVVVAVEEYARLKAIESERSAKMQRSSDKR